MTEDQSDAQLSEINQSIRDNFSYVSTSCTNEEDSEVEDALNEITFYDAESPNFGDINVEESRNVQVGSKNIYKGPVKIQQVFQYSKDLTPNEAINENRDNRSADNFSKNRKARSESWLSKRNAIVLSIIFVLFLLAAVITLIVFIVKSNTTKTSTSNYPGELTIVSRKEWNAMETKYPKIELNIPEYVIIIHTKEEADFCKSKMICSERVEHLQKWDILGLAFEDIKYNFLIGADGNIYEGRGWHVAGQHTFDYNNKSLGIAFMGDFEKCDPEEKQIRAAQKLLDYALMNFKVSQEYKLIGQRQVDETTTSPGRNVYKIIKGWDHWTQRV